MTVSTFPKHQTEEILFSVVIPCFNAERTLPRCLDSVLKQTFPPYEILIFDDSSTDGSKDVIRAYTEKHANIKLLHSTENRGAGYARNELLKHCTGNFVAFLDADDWWMAEKLQLQKQLIEETAAEVIGCKIRLLAHDGTTLGFRTPIRPLTFNKLLRFNHIGMSGAVVSLCLKSAREMPTLRKRQDYAYFLNIFHYNPDVKFNFCDTELVHYVRSSTGLSGESKLDTIKYNYLVLRKYGRLSKLNSILHMFIHIFNRLKAD